MSVAGLHAKIERVGELACKIAHTWRRVAPGRWRCPTCNRRWRAAAGGGVERDA